jgi:type VI protein secretion system component Hcp
MCDKPVDVSTHPLEGFEKAQLLFHAQPFDPLSIVKPTGPGTVSLFEDITNGVHLQEVVVRVFKPNSTTDHIRYTLEDALVTQFQQSGAVESLSFTYGRITIESSGSSYCFNVVQRREC